MKRVIVLFSLLIALFFANILVLKRNYMPIEDIEQIQYETLVDKSLTIDEAIERVNKHFNVNYTLKWRNGDCPAGQAILYVNIVYLKEGMDWVGVIHTLSHELCHIKYYSANETYVEYMAFKELYESDDEYLNLVGRLMITSNCQYRVYKGTEYDIGSQILKYFDYQSI